MNEQFTDAIRKFASSSAITKSKVGRIRELMPEIILAQQAGVRLADIARILSGMGFEGMNIKCLQNLLYQARKVKKLHSKKAMVQLIPPVIGNHNSIGIAEGISADSILEEARKSMQSKPAASSITLSLLRSQPTKSKTERK